MINLPSKTEIGQRIRQMRLRNDDTQAEFSEAVNISVNFLSEIENGKKGVSQDTLIKICQYLDVSADYLLFGVKPKQASIIELANSLSSEELETTIKYMKALLDMKKSFS